MPRTIALAGLGSAGRTIHLPAYASVPGLSVIGACDPAANAASFPFPVFPTLAELLEQARPDILGIASPPAAHFEQARAGLLAGCHVFCEKPFTATLAEADDLARLAGECGRSLVVNHEFRYMRSHLAIQRAIGTAEFGDLVFLSAFQSYPRRPGMEDGWRGQGNQRTCREFGIHVLDLCRFLFDAEPVRVHSRMPRGADAGGPDHLDLVTLDFPGDRSAHVTLDRMARGRHRYLDLRADGTAATIETSLGGRVSLGVGLNATTRRPFVDLDFARGGRARLYKGERFRTLAKEPSGIFAHATATLLGEMLGALDAGRTPPCHAEDARRSMALVQAAYDSDARGVAFVPGADGGWQAA